MNKTFENKVTTKGASTRTLDSGDIEFPVIVGTENEHAIDISKLRAKTGYITWDEGFMNTGATTSAITFLDGEAGILRYRGYPVEQLAANCDFIEFFYYCCTASCRRRPSWKISATSSVATRCCTRI